MAKTFNPDRVRPGTIEYVRDADGMYTTRVVGLESVNSLSLPEISDTAAVTKTDTDTKTATDITGDTVQKQTQMAFKTSDDRGPDTTGSMLQEATKLSRNLSDFNPDTASEQFARQAFIPRQSTFDAETEDSTEDRVSIKDPTENVFGKSTLEDEQRERQTTLPDLSVDVEKKEPPGLFGFKFDRPIRKEDFLGDRFKTTETRNTNPNLDRMAKDSIDDANRQEMISGATADDATANTLGITADSSIKPGQGFGVDPTAQVGGTDLEADAGTKARADIKPKESALKTVSTSLKSAFKNIKTPMMMGLETIGTPRNETEAAVNFNKNYFTDRGDGRIGGNPATDLFAGMNRVSAFGNLNQAGAKRIAKREKTIATKDVSDKFKRDTEKMKKQLNDYREAKAKDRDKRMGNTKTQVTGFGKTGLGRDTSQGGGDTGQDSGGKIVCTMMNESYGFGSFRNKIWLKFHKDYSAEYQKGYHKLFLPLVKYAKQKGIINKIIKNILEHIAVHSTIDMRQTLRGKRHTLGRLYRKVILPLCYWAGKK